MPTVSIDGTDYEVYADVEMANVYFAGSLNTDNWDAATDDTKGKALITATRLLDRQSWKGTKTGVGSPAQVLAWPRDGVDCPGVEAGVVPDGVINSTFELARYLLEGNDIQNEQNQSQKIQTMQAGSVSLTFFRGAEGVAYRFPLIVQELLGCYLSGAGGTVAGVIATGVDGESVTRQDFGHNRPL